MKKLISLLMTIAVLLSVLQPAWAIEEAAEIDAVAASRNLIVVVPGIVGSELVDGNGTKVWVGVGGMEMSRNVQSGNTQNLKSMVIQRSFPKWSVAERRKTAAASDQAAVCACAHSRYFTGGSPSGLRV